MTAGNLEHGLRRQTKAAQSRNEREEERLILRIERNVQERGSSWRAAASCRHNPLVRRSRLLQASTLRSSGSISRGSLAGSLLCFLCLILSSDPIRKAHQPAVPALGDPKEDTQLLWCRRPSGD